MERQANQNQNAGAQISQTNVRGIVKTLVTSNVSLVQEGNLWKYRFQGAQALPGIDVNRTYQSADEAVDSLMTAITGGTGFRAAS